MCAGECVSLFPNLVETNVCAVESTHVNTVVFVWVLACVRACVHTCVCSRAGVGHMIFYMNTIFTVASATGSAKS